MRLPSLYAATNEGSAAAVAETLEKCTCGVLSDSRVDKLDIYEGEWRRTRGGAEGGVGTEIRSKRQKRGGGGGGPPNRYSSHGGSHQASWRATTTTSRVNHQSTYSSIPEDRLVEPVAPTSKKLIVYEWDPTYLLAQGSTTYEVVSCYSLPLPPHPPPPPTLANSTCCPSLCSNTPGSGTHSLLLQQESS